MAPSRASNRVEPSMSLKSMVTVPEGSPIRALCWPLADVASLPTQLAIDWPIIRTVPGTGPGTVGGKGAG